MSTEGINRFGYLFPVKEENMDYFVNKHYLSKTYVSYKINDGGLDWFVSCIGDKVFLEANDDKDYFVALDKEPVEVSWHDLLESFRSVRYNDELYYMSGCDGHVPNNIYGAEGSHLYPNPSTLIHVLMKPSNTGAGLTINCKTIDIDGTDCVLIGCSPHELIFFYKDDDGYDLFAALPLGILSQLYTHGWMNGSIYDLRMAVATSKEALKVMTPDIKRKLSGDKDTDNGI
jgi:hypothetical protein